MAACIVTTSADKTARIWQLSDGSWRIRTLTGHTGMVMSAAVSPDGKLIVTASSDYTALWRLSEGNTVARCSVESIPQMAARQVILPA